MKVGDKVWVGWGRCRPKLAEVYEVRDGGFSWVQFASGDHYFLSAKEAHATEHGAKFDCIRYMLSHIHKQMEDLEQERGGE